MRAYITLIFFLVSCSLQKTTESNVPSIKQDKKSQIIFLVLKIHKDTSQKKNVIEYVSKTKTEGLIKIRNRTVERYNNYLTIAVYEDDNLADSFKIEHPLFKKVEYLEGSIFTSKSVELDAQEFFIRIQTKGISNKIIFYETLNNKNKKELTTITL